MQAFAVFLAAGLAAAASARATPRRALPALPAPAAGLSSLAAVAPRAWSDARAAAARLAQGRGALSPGRTIFLENLARYLHNAYSDETLRELASGEGPLAVSDLPPAPRWMDKIVRDLDTPYDDEKVREHLARLQAELEEAARLLKEWSPQGGYGLTLMGGLMRGRVSANSDLDVILRTDDQALFERAMTSPFGYLVKERLLILSPPPVNKRVCRALGPMLDIGDGSVALADPGFVARVYDRARAEAGVGVFARESKPETLELLALLKKLSKRALKYPPGDPRRLDIEEQLRQAGKRLEKIAADAPADDRL